MTTRRYTHKGILADYLAAHEGETVTARGVRAHVEHGGYLVTKTRLYPDRLECPTCGAACHELAEQHDGSLRCRRCAQPSLWQDETEHEGALMRGNAKHART